MSSGGQPPRTLSFAAYAGGDAPAEVVIGRGPPARVILDDPTVSAQHARVRRGPEGGLWIDDLGSSNGTYVNGQRVQSAAIRFTDDVRLGSAPVHLTDSRIAGLLVRAQRRAPVGQPMVVGSDPQSDVVVDWADVAPQHASLTESPDGGMVVQDYGSPSGTFVDNAGFRVQQARVSPNSVLIFGSFHLPVPLLRHLLYEVETGRGSLGSMVGGEITMDKQVLTIGRDPGNDVTLDHPTVSGRHATLARQPNGTIFVNDLGSTNGTYLNGERIETAVAQPGDSVFVGAVSLALGTRGIERAGRARVRLDLLNIHFSVHNRNTGRPLFLLDDVTMSVFPSEMVGMLGPSGAGKTTLLTTVLGLNRPTGGRILLNGRPLLSQYEAFRTNVGYVPQDDIVHPELTVREALYYACRLRLPAGTSRSRIEEAIDRTLKQVGLLEQKHTIIGSPERKILSGGQRRRVNLAVELVTDPSLLVLDEPTSGLSWTDAAEVIATLRSLADEGRTVVLTIHQPDYQEYEKFDTVAILGAGGKLLFVGPPDPESYAFFGATRGRPREMFDHVEQMDPDAWRERFRQTDTYRRFVVERMQDVHGEQSAHGPPPKPRKRSSLRQLPTLLARSMLLTVRNRAALVLLILQAPLLGLLIGLATDDGRTIPTAQFGCVDDGPDRCETHGPDRLRCDFRPARFGAAGDEQDDGAGVPDPRTGLLAILLSLFLPMVIVGANALVGERTIYVRERLAGLNVLPYLGSRFVTLALLGMVVATLNLAVSVPVLGLEGGFHKYWLVGVWTACCAAAIGLALSALVRSPVSALWGINLLIVPQLLFAGSISKLEGITAALSYLTTTRYGLEALTRVDLAARPALEACQVDRFVTNMSGFPPALVWPIPYAFTFLGLMTLGALIAAAILLKLRDRKLS
ncbi:MAG: FHA domain-containing protein [Polyangiales bacterium]